MQNPPRHASAAVLALLIGLTSLSVACSKTTTQAESAAVTAAPGSPAPTTARADTTKASKRSDTTQQTDDSRADGEIGDTAGGDGTSSSTSRRSTTTQAASDPAGQSQSLPTITVRPTSGNEAFCTTMANAYNELASGITLGSGNGSGGPNDVDAFEKALIETSKKLYATLAAAAPSDIKGDFETLNNVIQKATDVRQLSAAANEPEVARAAQNVEQWLAANCGISPKLM